MVMMMRRPLFAGFGISNEPVPEPSTLSVNKGRRHVDVVHIPENQPKASSRPGMGRSATVTGTRAPRRPFTSSGSTEADSTSNRHSVLRVADSRIVEEGANEGRATTSNGVPSAKNLVEAILGEPISGEPIFGGHRIRNRNGVAAPTMLDQRSNNNNNNINNIINMGNQQSPLPLQRIEDGAGRRIQPGSVPFEIPFEERREQFPAVASLAAVMEMDRTAVNDNTFGNTTGLTRSRSKWNPFSRSRSKSAKPANTNERRRSRIQMTNVQKSPYIARSVTDLDRMSPPMMTHSFTHIGPTSPCWSTTNSTVEEKEEEDTFLQDAATSLIQVAPTLNIDIPSYQLDRFSIMFEDLLERGSTPPLQDEGEGKFGKFESANVTDFQGGEGMPPLPRRATTPLSRSCSPAALSPPPSRESTRAGGALGAPVLLRSNTTPIEIDARLGAQEMTLAQSGGLARGISKRLVSRFNRHEHVSGPTNEPPHPIRTMSLPHNDNDKCNNNNNSSSSSSKSSNDIKIMNDTLNRPTLLPAAKIEEYPLRPSLEERSLRERPSTDFDDDDDDDNDDHGDHEDGDDSKSIHENVQIFIARQVSVSRRPQRLVIPVNKLAPVGPSSPGATTPTESILLETPMTPKVVHLSSPRLSAYRRSTLVAVSEV